MAIIAVLSPVLGTMADFNGRKKGMLGGFLAIGAASCAGMFFIYRGDWLLASILFILANIGANGSFVFYDALLPHIARDDEVHRVSTAGYALGYLGGGVLLALNLAWIVKPGWFGLPSGEDLTPAQATLPARLSFALGRHLVDWSSRSRCSVAFPSRRPPAFRPAMEVASCSRSARPSTGSSRPDAPSAGTGRPRSCWSPS